MNNPQDTDTASELVETEPPKSEDFDLSDEALDRPAGEGELKAFSFSGGRLCTS